MLPVEEYQAGQELSLALRAIPQLALDIILLHAYGHRVYLTEGQDQRARTAGRLATEAAARLECHLKCVLRDLSVLVNQDVHRTGRALE